MGVADVTRELVGFTIMERFMKFFGLVSCPLKLAALGSSGFFYHYYCFNSVNVH